MIKKIIIKDLIDGVDSDLKKRIHMRSVKDLLVYSYRVAGTVGLMMAKILKVNKKSSLKSAIDLGIAMQLTNISRDVIEDSKNNRYYIDEDFEKISSTIDLADTFYENSFFSMFWSQITLTTFLFPISLGSSLLASVAISELFFIAKLFKLIISFTSPL